jgi:hypothetical protein
VVIAKLLKVQQFAPHLRNSEDVFGPPDGQSPADPKIDGVITDTEKYAFKHSMLYGSIFVDYMPVFPAGWRWQ